MRINIYIAIANSVVAFMAAGISLTTSAADTSKSATNLIPLNITKDHQSNFLHASLAARSFKQQAKDVRLGRSTEKSYRHKRKDFIKKKSSKQNKMDGKNEDPFFGYDPNDRWRYRPN